MNLAGKRILVCGGRDFTDYPLLCGTLDGLFPALVLRPSDKSSARRPPVSRGRGIRFSTTSFRKNDGDSER
jgi:hypothetical protein